MKSSAPDDLPMLSDRLRSLANEIEAMTFGIQYSPAPLAYTVSSAARACDVAEGVIRHAIQVGNIVPRYPNIRPLILREDLVDWLRALPDVPRRMRG